MGSRGNGIARIRYACSPRAGTKDKFAKHGIGKAVR